MGESAHKIKQPPTAASVWQGYKVPIILGSVSLLCIAVSFALMVKSYQSDAPIQFSSDAAGVLSESSSSSQMLIAVDVEGAVAKPGLYKLPMGSRVEDAIAFAGGLSADADTDRIASSVNRASKISDGAKLYIPKKGDEVTRVSISSSDPNTLGTFGQTVNINAASQSELEALPGIGPVTAKKIISGRPYQTLEELVAKKAMSQSLFDKLRNELSL